MKRSSNVVSHDVEPCDADVLLDRRGNRYQAHAGNIFFKGACRKVYSLFIAIASGLTLCRTTFTCADLIAQHKDSFETLSPLDKKQIVHKIMDMVLQRTGRFLRRINNQWIVVAGDHAYLEVAQAIQYTRKQSRRKPIHIRPLAFRPLPASCFTPTESFGPSTLATGSVPEFVMAPRLRGASADSAVSIGRNDHYGGKLSRRSFHESDNEYNHEFMVTTLRQAMSDPRYTRLDACQPWNRNNPMYKVASGERDSISSPVASIEPSVDTSDLQTISPDLLSIATIGSFDSDEVDEIFQNIDW
jgi:hypothetical protein